MVIFSWWLQYKNILERFLSQKSVSLCLKFSGIFCCIFAGKSCICMFSLKQNYFQSLTKLRASTSRKLLQYQHFGGRGETAVRPCPILSCVLLRSPESSRCELGLKHLGWDFKTALQLADRWRCKPTPLFNDYSQQTCIASFAPLSNHLSSHMAHHGTLRASTMVQWPPIKKVLGLNLPASWRASVQGMHGVSPYL